MIANAWHHRADAISSVVALIGVGEELRLFLILVCFFNIFFQCPSMLEWRNDVVEVAKNMFVLVLFCLKWMFFFHFLLSYQSSEYEVYIHTHEFKSASVYTF